MFYTDYMVYTGFTWFTRTLRANRVRTKGHAAPPHPCPPARPPPRPPPRRCCQPTCPRASLRGGDARGRDSASPRPCARTRPAQGRGKAAAGPPNPRASHIRVRRTDTELRAVPPGRSPPAAARGPPAAGRPGVKGQSESNRYLRGWCARTDSEAAPFPRSPCYPAGAPPPPPIPSPRHSASLRPAANRPEMTWLTRKVTWMENLKTHNIFNFFREIEFFFRTFFFRV
jgi:hypothetical protein